MTYKDMPAYSSLESRKKTVFKLSKRSLKSLEGVHPDLIKVVKKAIEITEVDFVVIEGVRSVSKQRKLVEQGASKTMNSRHLTGHAVDLAAYDKGVKWDVHYYHKIAAAMKSAALYYGIHIGWGGDWESFFDGPHFQLNWKAYPIGVVPKPKPTFWQKLINFFKGVK